MSAGSVAAVVLSLGESSTERALASVRRQSEPVTEVHVVEGVRPFHRALNEGARRVRAPFFVQVDADMVLDDDCVAGLRACAVDGVAVVVGHLRDPLHTRVEGVKLFRTACFAEGGFPDSVSPDTDFALGLERRGWYAVWALRFDRPRELWHTFGDHAPAYEPLYTYGKFSLAGRRWRHRANAAALRHQLARLHASAHPASLLAEIALAHGVFLDGERDLLEPYREDADFARIARFIGTSRGHATAPPPRLGIGTLVSAKAAFRRAYALGIALGREPQRDRFAATLARVHGTAHPFDWLLQLGLCRGLFADRFDREAFERDWARLACFRSYYEPRGLARRLTLRLRESWGRVRARVTG